MGTLANVSRPRPPLIAIVLDAGNPHSRDVLAGILDHARPRGWRVGGEDAVADAAAVIADDAGVAPVARRRVTLSTAWRSAADVRLAPGALHELINDVFSRRGFDGWVDDPTDVVALPRPAACFFPDDATAAAGMRALLAAGVSVPDDVAVLGFGNDLLICERCPVPLSSIDVGARRIGRMAAERLSRVLAGRAVTGPTLLPPVDVIERASTATYAVDDADVLAAARLIREHGGGPLRVGDLIRASGLDRRTLERRFAKHFSRSPAEMIRRHRVDSAAKLLRDTALPVSEIARVSGFRLPQHLAVAFKAITGQTPTDYRASITGISRD